MNNVLTLILVTFFSTIGYAQAPNGTSQTPGGRFEITGVLSGFADSTLIYLDALEDTGSHRLDSTITVGNKFHLSGSINTDVVQAQITTKNMSDYKSFWSHPNSFISPSLLNVYASRWGNDTTLMLYTLLSGKMKYIFFSKKTAEFRKLHKGVKLGDRFADFTQPDTEGKNVSLSDYKGKIVLQAR